jgi:cytochrome c oxidase assembly protein subunit 15
MLMGSYVKAVYGGMSCPEWPTCMDGNIVVPLNGVQVASELMHRAAALVVVLAGAALLALILLRFGEERRLLWLTLAAGGTLAVQVSLGALTIFSNLEAAVVTAHLGVATVLLLISVFIAQEARKIIAKAAPATPATAPSGSSSAGSE